MQSRDCGGGSVMQVRTRSNPTARWGLHSRRRRDASECAKCDRCAGRSPGVSGPLGDRGLASLVAMAGQRHWAKRQVLYHGDDAADAFYRITKGIVAEFKDLRGRSPPDRGDPHGRRHLRLPDPTRGGMSSPVKRSRRSRPARSGLSNSAPPWNATPQFACAVADDGVRTAQSGVDQADSGRPVLRA